MESGMTDATAVPSAEEEVHQKSAAPMEDWTISQLLNEGFPGVALRQRFRLTPYLEQVTLREVLEGPFALQRFLEECRRQPQCGDTSVKRLREVIERAALTMAAR